jgi:hypothetical protein
MNDRGAFEANQSQTSPVCVEAGTVPAEHLAIVRSLLIPRRRIIR